MSKIKTKTVQLAYYPIPMAIGYNRPHGTAIIILNNFNYQLT